MYKKILVILILLISMVTDRVYGDEKFINIYLFYSDTCPHCHEEIEFFDEIDNNSIRLYKYEISEGNNSRILDEIGLLYDTVVKGVPFTVIGDKVFKGFNSSNHPDMFKGAIEYYSKYGYKDRVGEYLNEKYSYGIEISSYSDDIEIDKDVNTYIEEYSDKVIDIPLIGEVSIKNMTLPIVSILIGFIDGFNPCAMWVLLFLISMLLGMNDKKKMIILGSIFILTSAIIYLVFMLAWLNLANLLVSISYIRILIGIIALVGAIINIRSYIIHRKDTGCDIVDDNKRNKIFNRIKKFTKEKNFILAIGGIILLACSVNIIELACSAGLPVMFIEILSMNNLSFIEEFSYILLYMFFFMIDDIIIFLLAVKTTEVTGISTKYGKITKLVGGILLLLIGVLLIFKPEWIMLNF